MPVYKKVPRGDADQGVMYEVQPFKKEKDREHIKQFLRGKKSLRDYCLFVLGCSVGLRMEDLLVLKVGDVSLSPTKIKSKVQVVEQKTDKFREITINKDAQKAISEYLQQRGEYDPNVWLFPSRNGKGEKHLDVESVRQLTKKFCKDCKVRGNYGAHSYRKTFGYLVYTQNADNPLALPTLQKIFQHSSTEITLRYIGITRDEIENVYQNLKI